MTSSLIRCIAVVAAFAALEMEGKGQANAPRAQPAYSSGGGSNFGNPAGSYPNPNGMNAGPSGSRMEVVDPDKKLAAGDQLTVEIVEDREGGFPRVVTATGDLDVPPLGRVHVANKTTLEASADIKRRLEADYYYHATVRLSIDAVSPIRVKSGVVYLSGELRQIGPQEMLVGEPLTLSNAILKANGFTEWANQRKVRVTRKTGSSQQTLEYDVKAIIEKGDINNDPILQDGDRINVPKLFFKG